MTLRPDLVKRSLTSVKIEMSQPIIVRDFPACGIFVAGQCCCILSGVVDTGHWTVNCLWSRSKD